MSDVIKCFFFFRFFLFISIFSFSLSFPLIFVYDAMQRGSMSGKSELKLLQHRLCGRNGVNANDILKEHLKLAHIHSFCCYLIHICASKRAIDSCVTQKCGGCAMNALKKIRNTYQLCEAIYWFNAASEFIRCTAWSNGLAWKCVGCNCITWHRATNTTTEQTKPF